MLHVLTLEVLHVVIRLKNYVISLLLTLDHALVQEIKRHALRLLQCRVLLLAHASSCTQDNRKCQLSPLCESVRQLLGHMKRCKKRLDSIDDTMVIDIGFCLRDV